MKREILVESHSKLALISRTYSQFLVTEKSGKGEIMIGKKVVKVQEKYFDNQESFLSSSVKVLLSGNSDSTVKVNNTPINPEHYDRYFCEDGVYIWKELEKLFPVVNMDDTKFTHEFGLFCVTTLRPIWIRSELYFSKVLSPSNYRKFVQDRMWLGQETEVWEIINAERTDICHIEQVLFLTSILEHALGDVYVTVAKRNPPHLFRDLLNTEELRSVFGLFPMFFLKAILGTPKCVNVRNIVWHGFPSANEIPTYYVAVLVLVIVTLSRTLIEKNVLILSRKKIINMDIYFNDINFIFDVTGKECEIFPMDLFQTSNSSKLVPKSHLSFWQKIIQLYRSGKYARCILLLLPQLEQSLRILYGELNRMSTSARCDEYYIIMDTILNENVENSTDVKCNRIYQNIEEAILKIMYDIFLSPFGPRMRDKLSHGEVDLNTLNKKMCLTLLHLSFAVLFDDFKISYYESKYHPNSLLQTCITETKHNLRNFKLLRIPEALVNLVDWKSGETLLDSQEWPMNANQIKIFYRPTKESEVIGHLLQICRLIDTSCINLLEALKEKIISFEEKSLRSKRRETLNKMLTNLPKLYYYLKDNLQILQLIFGRLQQNGHVFLENQFGSIQKFIKKILKNIENISKYCDKSSNEWQRSVVICSDFGKLLEKYKEIVD